MLRPVQLIIRFKVLFVCLNIKFTVKNKLALNIMHVIVVSSDSYGGFYRNAVNFIKAIILNQFISSIDY